MEKQSPIIPEIAPKIRYSVPISLWLVEYNHFWIQFAMWALTDSNRRHPRCKLDALTNWAKSPFALNLFFWGAPRAPRPRSSTACPGFPILKRSKTKQDHPGSVGQASEDRGIQDAVATPQGCNPTGVKQAIRRRPRPGGLWAIFSKRKKKKRKISPFEWNGTWTRDLRRDKPLL